MRNMNKVERRRMRKANGFHIGTKVLRQYSLSWWVVLLVGAAAVIAFLSIPGSIDAAAGMVPR